MKEPSLLYQDPESGCRALETLFQRTGRTESPLNAEDVYMLADFLARNNKIHDDARRLQSAARILRGFAPAEVRKIVGPIGGADTDFNLVSGRDQETFDVAVLAVKLVELRAAKIAFGVPLDKREDRRDPHYGYRYWHTFFRTADGKTVKVVLSMVGRERNVHAANACWALLENYSVKLFALVGMAAGLKKSFRQGDVFIAETVWDYEYQRLEPKQSRPRPEVISLAAQTQRDLAHFDDDGSGWRESLKELTSQLKNLDFVETALEGWRPNVKRGVLLSGDKLVADGSMQGRREATHDRAIALEMEGSGFARTCHEKGIPWVIFRGISDFGDLQSKGLSSGEAVHAVSTDKSFAPPDEKVSQTLEESEEQTPSEQTEKPSVDSKVESSDSVTVLEPVRDRDRKAWQEPATLAACLCLLEFLKFDYRFE